MNVVSLTGVSKAYGDRVVLSGVTVGLEHDCKIGLLGVNGSGKSTLFRILVGLEQPDSGSVARHRDLSVGYLPQDPRLVPGRTVWQTVSEGLEELLAARREVEQTAVEIEGAAGQTERLSALLDRYEALQQEVIRLGGWETDHLVSGTLMALGVSNVAREMVDKLSGGQQKRVALARVLLARPSLLVLDEPTNHLDADTVEWLESTLRAWPGAVALITHDRYFLDNVVGRMWEVSDGVLHSYEGNYTRFVGEKHARLRLDKRTTERRLKLLEKELAWLNRTPAARRGKQKARAQRAETLVEEVGQRSQSETLSLAFEPAQELKGNEILNATRISVGFGAETLVRDFSLRMVHGDRIGIIGPNGCGKTTLLRALLKHLPPQAGRVEHGSWTKVGYFDQERAGISPAQTITEAVCPSGDHVRVGGRRIHVRRYLQQFLFPLGEQQRRFESLSGGERSRVLLARLVAEGANLLVLDEPTNDLDLDTLQVLEDALTEFSGCLLVVTHDRYFLNRVANRILAFEESRDGETVVSSYAGDYDIYLRLRRAEKRAAPRASRRPVEAPPKKKRLGLSWREKAELEALEERIAVIEERLAKVERLLSDPTRLSAEHMDLTRLGERHAELLASLEKDMERWAVLMERG